MRSTPRFRAFTARSDFAYIPCCIGVPMGSVLPVLELPITQLFVASLSLKLCSSNFKKSTGRWVGSKGGKCLCLLSNSEATGLSDRRYQRMVSLRGW
jgi:hypothetical protein